MAEPTTGLRAFKPVFVVLGLIYVLMASSALVKGTVFLEDFGVSHELASDPVLTDFFMFLYQLMAFVGVLTVLFGLVTRERRAQVQVASLFFVACILLALRDLSTSDTRFGSALYKGEETVFFVVVSVVYAMVFGSLAIMGLRRGPAS
jgi:heme A synthase